MYKDKLGKSQSKEFTLAILTYEIGDIAKEIVYKERFGYDKQIANLEAALGDAATMVQLLNEEFGQNQIRIHIEESRVDLVSFIGILSKDLGKVAQLEERTEVVAFNLKLLYKDLYIIANSRQLDFSLVVRKGYERFLERQQEVRRGYQ